MLAQRWNFHVCICVTFGIDIYGDFVGLLVVSLRTDLGPKTGYPICAQLPFFSCFLFQLSRGAEALKTGRLMCGQSLRLQNRSVGFASSKGITPMIFRCNICEPFFRAICRARICYDLGGGLLDSVHASLNEMCSVFTVHHFVIGIIHQRTVPVGNRSNKH